VRYEGYGPGGVAVLIEALTDNRNRTAADVRLAFSKHGGNLGETGCVGYLFEQLSMARVAWPSRGEPTLDEEALLESLLPLAETGDGSEAVEVLRYDLLDEGSAEVFAPFAQLESLQDGLRRAGFSVLEWEHRWIAGSGCRLEDADQLRRCLKLLDALEELDDVGSVTANLEAEDALLEALEA
jgi:transcriptional/translational regulatory protein YebC/TACO1